MATLQLTNDLDNKRFASAIAGMCKLSIHNETSMDRSTLSAKIFAKSKMSNEEQTIFLENLAQLLRTAAQKGWTHVELVEEAKNTEFVVVAEEQAEILGQYWKAELIHVRSSVAKATTFNHQLSHFTWRIDMKSDGGDGSNDAPCALLEMNVADRVRMLCISILSLL